MPKYIISCQNSVAYKNSNLYQLVALYENGEQEGASSKTPLFQFWPEHGIHQPTKVLDAQHNLLGKPRSILRIQSGLGSPMTETLSLIAQMYRASPF